jgi:hypothetical protein
LKNKKIKRKTMWKNTAAMHNILKEKNYKAKFLPAQYLKNKINKNNFRKKK